MNRERRTALHVAALAEQLAELADALTRLLPKPAVADALLRSIAATAERLLHVAATEHARRSGGSSRLELACHAMRLLDTDEHRDRSDPP